MNSHPAHDPPLHNGIGVLCAAGQQRCFRWPGWMRGMDGRRIKSIAIDQFDNLRGRLKPDRKVICSSQRNTPKQADNSVTAFFYKSYDEILL